MAYRQSDHLRWMQLDFVTGMKIELSNNHTVKDPHGKGVLPLYDICDELAGNYPKDFKFVGWHPQCRCHATPILRPLDEIDQGVADSEGNWKSLPSSSEVKDTPKNFQDYMRANEERFARWKSTPYYLKDNPQWVDKALHPEKYKVIALVLDDATQKRLTDFEMYGFNHQGSTLFNDALNRAKEAVLKGQQEAFDKAMAEMEARMKKNEASNAQKAAKRAAAKIDPIEEARKKMLADDLATFTDAQRKNIAELEAALKQKKGLRMDYKEANTGKENPNYRKDKQYKVNCQTCTVIHELRRRGFNVEAVGNNHGSVWKVYKKQGVGSSIEGYRIGKWLKEDGTPAKPYYASQWERKKGYKTMTKERVKEFFDEVAPNDGRYEIYVDWKGGSSHVFCAERKDGKWFFFDPQSGKENVLDRYIADAKLKSFGIIRTDNKLINAKLAETFIPRGELPIVVQLKTRAEIIQENAAKRHAARSQQKIDELKKFAADHAEKTRKAYDEIMQTVNDGKKFRDIDMTKQVDMMTAITGVKMQSGKIAGVSLEKQLAEAKGMRVRMQELVKEAKTLNDLIPGADGLLSQYSLSELQSMHKVIKTKLEVFESMPLRDQERLLTAEIQCAQNSIIGDAFKRRLEVVKVDIKVEELTPDITAINAIAKNSKVNYFKNAAQKAEDELNLRNVVSAEAELRKAQAVKDAVKEYEDMLATGYSTGLYNAEMQMALDALEIGDTAEARNRMAKAAAIKARNEASRLARARAAAEKKAREEAERLAKEEAATKPKKRLPDAKNVDDIREVMGSETPVLLQHYEKSVQRDRYTRSEYLAHQDEFHDKMKEMFDNSNFSHCFRPQFLDGYIEEGILTNLQSGKGDYSGRRAYGHFAYGFQNDQRSVPRKEWLRNGDYYRCGVPVDKDPTIAYKQTSGYGDCQLILRKEKLVTTFTFDNSLGEDTIPSLTCDPKVCSLDRKGMVHFNDAKYNVKNVADGAWAGYIEIQYLPPSSSEYIGPEYFQSITLPVHPVGYHGKTKEFWQKWADKGVDVLYLNPVTKKVEVYLKGASGIPAKYEETAAERKARQARAAKRAEERHMKRNAKLVFKDKISPDDQARKLWAERAAEQVRIKEKAQNLIAKEADYVNKDVSFDKLKELMAKGNYMGARAEGQRLKQLVAEQTAREDALKDFFPDVKDLHKQFTIEELEVSHKKIQEKIDYIKNHSRNLKEELTRWEDSVTRLNDPASRKRVTWAIEQKVYQRKVDETKFAIRKEDTRSKISTMLSDKKGNAAYKKLLKEADKLLQADDLDGALKLIQEAEHELELEQAKTALINAIKFDEKLFSQKEKDKALWFKNEKDPQKAFNEVDRIMSKYTEELWQRLDADEKHLLYLYTTGSKWVNEPLMNRFYGTMKYSPIDGSRRKSVDDINALTEIIEKAKPLEQGMWVQHTEGSGAILSRFGISRMPSDPSKLVGLEGVNTPFMSTSCAKYSHFSKEELVSGLDVVMSIYLPKGTKGVYCEPFAHWGDGKKTYSTSETTRYQTKAVDWNGKSRQDAGYQASAQVEFLVQRGAKLKITKAEFKNGRWYIDCDLVEQTAVQKFDNHSLSMY